MMIKDGGAYSGSLEANMPAPAYLSSVDDTIISFMRDQDIPGAGLAISYHGKLVYQQGYGIAGPGRRVSTKSRFRIASVSKTLTAIGILKLCEQGQLKLDTCVFGQKGILSQYKCTHKGDRRLHSITIQHLLQHSAGWDRDVSGDPVFWKLGKVMKTLEPTHSDTLLRYMMTRKLQFAPGKRHAYSNLGYQVLGLILEAVVGKDYEQYMNSLLQEFGVAEMKVGYTKHNLCHEDEVDYFQNRLPLLKTSIYPNEGLIAPQYGSFMMEETGPYGGWVASPTDLVCIFDGLSGDSFFLKPDTVKLMLSRPTYETGHEWYGFGLDVQDDGLTWGHTGAMEGTSCTVMHHKSGLTWALLFNAWSKDMDIDGLMKYSLSGVKCWPLVYEPWSWSDDFDILYKNSQQGVKLLLAHHDLQTHLHKMTLLDYRITWINAVTWQNKLYFNIIWTKDMLSWYVVFNVGKEDFGETIEAARSSGYSVHLLEAYAVSQRLLHIIVFGKSAQSSQIVHCLKTLEAHLQNVKHLKYEGYILTVQSVISISSGLFVSSVFERDTSSISVHWVGISLDCFQYEVSKQAKRKLGLVYLKFYDNEDTICVSAVWSSRTESVHWQRYDVSWYGFMYELRQCAEKNLPLYALCSYPNEGVMNFSAVWLPSKSTGDVGQL